MPPEIAYLPVERIREAAESVLNEFQSDRAIPVDIEDIIEFGLEMEIRPVKALYGRFGFEGALTHDLETIVVDADTSTRSHSRYRFTLAHELGHRILHGEFIASMTIEDKEDWKAAVERIDASTYGRMEHQAYMFAGHVLVPTSALKISCQEAQSLANRHGIDLSAMGESAIGQVAGRIAKEYRVSTAVIERRIRNDEINFAE